MVLEVLVTQIVEADVELSHRILVNASGYTNSTRIGHCFQASRDIHSVPKDVAVLDDDVALVNANAIFNTRVLWPASVPLGYLALDFDGAMERVHDAGELDKQPIAVRLYDAAAMLAGSITALRIAFKETLGTPLGVWKKTSPSARPSPVTSKAAPPP
jgi:hypothetical protein